MKRENVRYLALALIIVGFLISSCVVARNAFGQQAQPTPIPGKYIHDFANLLSDEQEAELTVKALELKNKYKTELAVVTLPTLNGEPPFDYSLRLARAWRIGAPGGETRGLMIVHSLADRSISIRPTDHIEGELTDGILGSIRREMGEHFKVGDYVGGYSVGLDRILAREAEAFAPAPSIAPAPAAVPTGNRRLYAGLAYGGGSAALLALLLAFYVRRKIRREEAAEAVRLRSRPARPTPPFMSTAESSSAYRTPSRATKPYEPSERPSTRSRVPLPMVTELVESPRRSYESTYSSPPSPSPSPVASPPADPPIYSGGDPISGGGTDGTY